MPEKIGSLKIMVLNAENLFLLSDQAFQPEHIKLDEVQWQKLSTSVYDNKPLAKSKSLAKIVLDENPDIVSISEVGGYESLNNFSSLFLNNLYSPALIEGNSERNIDVGYLIKKNAGFYFDVVSNKHRPINYTYPHEVETKPSSLKFSRDVSELHLFKKDKEKPFLLFLTTHLKSRLDPDGIDPNGFERRQAELRTLLEIYNEWEEKFQQKIPIVVCGDFNGNASQTNTDPEFQPIYQTSQLQDVLELAQFAADKRSTYYQVGRNSKSEGKQLDYAFLSPQAKSLLDTTSVQVYRYKDHLGLEFDPPTTLDAKLNLPSDHYPIFFTLKDIPIY